MIVVNYWKETHVYTYTCLYMYIKTVGVAYSCVEKSGVHKRRELHVVVLRSPDYIKRGELYGVCGE